METALTLEGKKVYRILVVDDDRDMNEMVCDIMRGEGYELYSAFDAVEGIEKARETRPDIILMDISMPGMTGLNACERLNADSATAGIPVIIVSARCDLKSKLSSYSAGARRYMTKPVEFGALSAEVKRLLGRTDQEKGGGGFYGNPVSYLTADDRSSGI